MSERTAIAAKIKECFKLGVGSFMHLLKDEADLSEADFNRHLVIAAGMTAIGVIAHSARDREDALEGLAALYRDMQRNLNKIYGLN